ncbi:GNAT family N-acetyltransferase [Mycoplasmatota bacterium]|nr:GNAT family N-acetyltransferase [Mycoplasmatota bacterium]
MNKNIDYKTYISLHEKCDETFAKVAKLRWNTPDEKIIRTVDWMKKNNFGEIHGTMWFEIVAYNDMKDIVGYCFFMQNPKDRMQWYLGDLIIDEMYRKQSIATNIIKIGINMALENKGKHVYAYIEKENIPSISLHEKLGFRNLKRLEPFADFIFGNDQSTFEYNI